MPAKKVAQKKGGRAGATPKCVPPALFSSDEENGPSLQDLAEKIAALEKAKARKHSAEVNSEATPAKQTRAAARKRELWALYTRLAQLQDSDEEDNVQEVMGGETSTVLPVPGKSHTPKGAGSAAEAQQGLTQGNGPDTEADGTGVATVAEAPQPGGAGAEDVGQVRQGLGSSLPTPQPRRILQATAAPAVDGGKAPSWARGPLDWPSTAGETYPDRGAPLVKYLDLIHQAYKEYAGVGWLRYDEFFHSRAALDPSLPWDREHQQLWSSCLGSTGVVAGSNLSLSDHEESEEQEVSDQNMPESEDIMVQAVMALLVDKLTSDNYTVWSLWMEHYLKQIWDYVALWDYVASPAQAPSAEDTVKDEKALATIILSVADYQLVRVTHKDKAKEAWNSLKSVYVQQTAGSLISLMR
ncbi:UNVERIFIED_CONTAM: hypothetical protein K2H54_058578 [Gekko kuhli]